MRYSNTDQKPGTADVQNMQDQTIRNKDQLSLRRFKIKSYSGAERATQDPDPHGSAEGM
jgi:hypothetical protein